jgi:hypothetical protein
MRRARSSLVERICDAAQRRRQRRRALDETKENGATRDYDLHGAASLIEAPPAFAVEACNSMPADWGGALAEMRHCSENDPTARTRRPRR